MLDVKWLLTRIDPFCFFVFFFPFHPLSLSLSLSRTHTHYLILCLYLTCPHPAGLRRYICQGCQALMDGGQIGREGEHQDINNTSPGSPLTLRVGRCAAAAVKTVSPAHFSETTEAACPFFETLKRTYLIGVLTALFPRNVITWRKTNPV